MKTLFRIVNQNRFFYQLNSVLLVLICFFLCFFNRADGFIWCNQMHTLLLRNFFEQITFLGDGWFSVVVALYFFIFSKKNKKIGFMILLAYLSSGLFSQIMKHLIISPRPKVYFERLHLHYFLDTFSSSRVGLNSFPSGHTASFFALATVFSNYFRKRHICIVALFLSVLVGYSRIYLAHHFLIDVLFGAIIGVLFGSFSIIWIRKLYRLKKVKHFFKSFKYKQKSSLKTNFSR